MEIIQNKFYSTNKYDEFINDLYNEDIHDENDIDIIKILMKEMTLNDNYVKM